jgi:hypothetical protein
LKNKRDLRTHNAYSNKVDSLFNRGLIELTDKSTNKLYHNNSFKKQKYDDVEFFGTTINNNKVATEKKQLNTIILNFAIKNGSEELKNNLKISVNINNSVGLLKECLLDKLRDIDRNRFKKVSIPKMCFYSRSSLMKDSKLIKDFGLENDDTIEVISEELIDKKERSESSRKLEKVKSIKLHKSEFCPQETLPQLTKHTLKTTPNFVEICRMTTNELSKVRNFSIFNDYGSISWEKEVDLRNLNLDEIIEISHMFISVYQGKVIVPELGQGLNHKALLKLKNMRPDSEENYEEYLESLKQWVLKLKGKEFKYNKQSGELEFIVTDFSK